MFVICDSTPVLKSDDVIFKRSFNDAAQDLFMQNLNRVQWDEVLMDDDVQSAYTKFHNIFSELYHNAFPIKKVTTKYKNRKMWLTSALKNSIKEKNELSVKSIKNPTESKETFYRLYKNKLNRLLKQAEKNHYHELFEKHKDNIKKSWSLIKDIVNKKKHTINCSKFNINGNKTTNKKQIADGFNTFFTEVGPMLAKNIKDSNVDPSSYINDVIRESIFLTPVTNVEVEKIILCMKNSAAGWDDIKGDIIKKCYPLFIDTFTHIYIYIMFHLLIVCFQKN